MKQQSVFFGWTAAAFFLGGAIIIDEYWKDQQGGVNSFSDFMHWLAGGWGAGQLCAIAAALFQLHKIRQGGIDSEIMITAAIGTVVGFVPLGIVAGIAWVARGFRRKPVPEVFSPVYSLPPRKAKRATKVQLALVAAAVLGLFLFVLQDQIQHARAPETTSATQQPTVPAAMPAPVAPK
jgi:hypothetical protein